MRRGIFERIFDGFQDDVFPDCRKNPELKSQAGIVKIDQVVSLVKNLQSNELDAHILVAGQNGSGKSMLLLKLMKKIDPQSIKNEQLLYAFNTHSDFITKLGTLRRTVLGVDEMNTFLHYKEGMTTESIEVANFIEVARANEVAIVGCIRDPRRINNNYRDGKVAVVLWVLDRFESGSDDKSLALVFLGNPVLEETDKFQFSRFNGLRTFEDIRLVAESLPTFMGYLFVDDVLNDVSTEELQIYKDLKRVGMDARLEHAKNRIDQKSGAAREALEAQRREIERIDEVSDPWGKKPLNYRQKPALHL